MRIGKTVGFAYFCEHYREKADENVSLGDRESQRIGGYVQMPAMDFPQNLHFPSIRFTSPTT